MIKTALLVVALLGSEPYETEMPNMVECLQAREGIKLQNPDIETICLPYTPPQDAIRGIIEEFVGKCQGDDKWPKNLPKRD